MQVTRPLAREARGLSAFLAALGDEAYTGDVATNAATRTVMATDNSVYELLPAAVLFPREPDDLNRILRASARTKTPVVARGGGTGTNGQSLTTHVVVDCSRHLRAIESIDPERGLAVVQPGVILDELNRAAAPHGLFFAPAVSTASRATLGGMTATDASGKGSRHYGRTSDHIAAMEVALSDGSNWRAEPLDARALDAVCARQDLPGRLHRLLRDIVRDEADEIERVFPVMNRGLTGYNLKELNDADGRFRLSKVLAGSEGSLALTKRLTLKLLKKPPHRALMVVGYDDVIAALRDVGRLVEADPSAVEFIDDRILSLAKDDPIWADIAGTLATPPGREVKGLNFVEVEAGSGAELAAALARLEALPQAPSSAVTQTIVREPRIIAQLWSLRSKCVGLLGRMDPSRQGTAFVEDAAVPPQVLPDFVEGFRALLDAHGLAYGMFGHADVGCVHVRPALDMRIPEDAAKLKPVSDAVAALAQRHGGLIWGEHGKGFRGQYGPQILGDRLYAAMCRIKAAFDPDDRLNPGKIAAPSPDRKLERIDTVPFRGPMDATIPPARLGGFEKAVKCNGNGQCFGRDAFDAMCPSYKATGDRLQSPKGRAALMRAWLREDGALPDGEIATALHASLRTCLACKACASQCPVKVDIPSMRARFLSDWHETHRRPMRHRLLAAMETFAPAMRALPGLANAGLGLAAPLLRALDLVDLPAIRPARGERRRLDDRDDRPGVVLIEDTFTATWDGGVVEAAETLFETLGYRVHRVAAQANGKALHVLGKLDRFEATARRALAREAELVTSGMPLVGIEPAVNCLHADEYRELRKAPSPVVSVEAFLASEIAVGRIAPRTGQGSASFALFQHCTGKTADPASTGRWLAIFRHLGLDLDPEDTGCCGMSGFFGHEAPNAEMSKKLFAMSWQPKLARHAPGTALATGFSCRCQAKRMGAGRLPHPVEVLAEAVASGLPATSSNVSGSIG
nr:FAD-binding and (Fe-S)-binding domain-containing protein [Jiella avicenniae]